MDPEKFDRTSPDRFMKSEHTSLELIGTDRTMALNALRETNNIGSFKGLGLFQETTLVLPLLQYAVDEVILEPDHDTWFTRRWPEQAADFLFAEYDNPLKVNTQRYVDFEVIPDDDPVKK